MDLVYKHYNNYVRPDKVYETKGEFDKDDIIVTEQGYMPVRLQIERFMQAGVVLQTFKRSLWDKTPEDANE